MWRSAVLRSLRLQCGSDCLLTIQGNKQSNGDAGSTDQQGEARECIRLAASQGERLTDEEAARPTAVGVAGAKESQVEQATWEQTAGRNGPDPVITSEFPGSMTSEERTDPSRTASPR